MEDTPAAAAPEGVQVRTAGGRVATVTICDWGWYSATLDDKVNLAPDEGGAGESIKKQRSFFASDQGELLQTVPKVERSRSGTKKDTPIAQERKRTRRCASATRMVRSCTARR